MVKDNKMRQFRGGYFVKSKFLFGICLFYKEMSYGIYSKKF